MIDFITLILSLSATATLLFGLVRFLDKIGYPINGIYILEKIVCGFYLLPAIIIIGYVYTYHTSDTTVFLHTEDFSYINYDGHLSELLLLKHDKMLQTVNFVVAIIWGLGFIVFFVADLVRSMVLLRTILKRCDQITDGYLMDLMVSIKKDLNLKGGIELYQSGNPGGPFTTGFFNMKIVLPRMDNSGDELAMLLRHELIHCKRHDVFMKILVRFVQKVHWFNPVIFFFSRKFCEECEYTCDMEVVRNYNREKRIQYGELILKMAGEYAMPKFTIGFSENDFVFVERRLKYLMKKNVKKGITMMITTAVFVATCPVMTYAAVYGVGYTEGIVIGKYDEHRSHEVENDFINNMVKWENSADMSEGDYIGNLNLKGANNVDTTLKGNGIGKFSPVSMKAGSSIRIVVYSDRESDSFQAGIIAPDGKKYYSSSVNGTVSQTFSIDTNGSYTVYIEGQNGSGGEDIHITGTIYVNY